MGRRGMLLGLGFAAVAVWARRRGADRVEVRHILPAGPEEVAALIGQVEREPEFIPGVRSVTVLERGPDRARYRVDLVGGFRVRYRKTWSGGRVAWTSEDGSLGVRQAGRIDLIDRVGSTDARLRVETAFDAPGIGPLAAAASHPFAAYAFRAWLVNLGRALEAGAPGAPGPGAP